MNGDSTRELELELEPIIVPPDLAAIARQADAQLAGADPAAELSDQADQAAASEREQLAGLLNLGVRIAGRALPSVAKAYTPQACDAIAGEFVTCAEHYGWTWHRGLADSPAIGLAAAIVVPAVVAWPEISADVRRLRAPPEPAPAVSEGAQLRQLADQVPAPHAGIRL